MAISLLEPSLVMNSAASRLRPSGDHQHIARRSEMSDSDLYRVRPFCDWHEDHGSVIWWLIPVSEAPYVGSPLDLGRKESHEITDGLAIVIDGVNAWPFNESDQRRLWWTPLPDAKRIEDQIPL
jgi:hypothetical protein